MNMQIPEKQGGNKGDKSNLFLGKPSSLLFPSEGFELVAKIYTFSFFLKK